MATGQQIADYYVRIGADKSGLSAGLSGAQGEYTNFAAGVEQAMGRAAGATTRGTQQARNALIQGWGDPQAAGAQIGRGFVTGLVGQLGPMAIGMAAGAAITGTVKTVVSLGIAYNSLKESANIAFTTMLGGAEKAAAMMKELEDFAVRTPFTFQDLTTGAQRMMAMGFAAEEVLPALRSVGDAAAAMGGSPETIDRITRALGQMQSKGAIASQEMLQLAESGIPAWRYLADTLGVTIPQAMKMVESRAVDAATGIKAILAGMDKDYGGMMEKQATTFKGLSSTIGDQVKQVAALITSPLFDSLKAGMSELANDWFPGMLARLDQEMQARKKAADVTAQRQAIVDQAEIKKPERESGFSLASLLGAKSKSDVIAGFDAAMLNPIEIARQKWTKELEAARTDLAVWQSEIAKAEAGALGDLTEQQIKALKKGMNAARVEVLRLEGSLANLPAAINSAGYATGWSVMLQKSMELRNNVSEANRLLALYGGWTPKTPVVSITPDIPDPTDPQNRWAAGGTFRDSGRFYERLAAAQDEGAKELATTLKDTGTTIKSAYDDLRSSLEGIMSPTSATEEDMLAAKLGKYTEKWDEYRRRMQDVVNQGGKSPWAGTYGISGSEDEIRLEAMRRMSAFDRYDFSKVPENERGAMKAAIKEQYRQQIEAQRNKKAILDELAGEMGISGSEYANLTGDSTMMGQQFAEGVTTAMGDSGIAQPLATAWRDDIEKNKDVLIDAGKSAGAKLVGGILTALKEGEFIQTMARAVAPEVEAIINRKKNQAGQTP